MDWKPNYIGPQSRVPALPLAGCRGPQGLAEVVGVSGVHWGLGGGVGAQGAWGANRGVGGIRASRGVGASEG